MEKTPFSVNKRIVVPSKKMSMKIKVRMNLKLFGILFIIGVIIGAIYTAFNFRRVQFFYYDRIVDNYEKLKQVEDKALEENPFADWAFINKIIRYKVFKDIPEDEQRLYKKITDVYTKRIEINPEDPKNYLDRASFDMYVNLSFSEMGRKGKSEIPWDVIIVDVEKAVELDPEPKDVMVYGRRGVIYFYAGNRKKAIVELTKYIKHDMESTFGYYWRAWCYFKTSEFGNALDDFNFVLSKEPDNGDAYYGRGCVYCNKKEFDKALSDMDMALQYNADKVKPYLFKGHICRATEEFDKAIANYNHVLVRDYWNEEAAIGKAIACDKTGRSNDALEFYERYLKKSKMEHYTPEEEKKRELVKQRIIELEGEKKTKYLEELVKEISEKDREPDREELDDEVKKNQELNSLMDEIKEKCGYFYYDWINAEYTSENVLNSIISLSDKALALKPNTSDATYILYNRGFSYYYKGEYDKAVEDYMKAHNLQPEDYMSINKDFGFEEKPDYGVNDLKWGRAERPIDFYSLIIRKNPNASEAYYFRGWAYSIIQEYSKAISDLTKSIEIFPKDHTVFQKRAGVYMMMGKLDEAIGDRSAVIDLMPTENVDYAYMQRAEVYFEAKQYQNAINDFDMVINLAFEKAKEICNKNSEECIEKEVTRIFSNVYPHWSAIWSKAEALAGIGKNEDAIKTYKQYIKYGEMNTQNPDMEGAKKRIKELSKL